MADIYAPSANYAFNPNVRGEGLQRVMNFATQSAEGGYSFDDQNVYALNPIARFMGVPVNTQYVAAFDKKHRNFQYPKAYDGRVDMLGEIVTGLVAVNDMSFIFSSDHGLPIKRTNEMKWSWSEWKFDTPLLQIEPEEGVARIIRAGWESDSATTVRRGIALYVEHGFFKTPQGLQHFYRSLQQIENAVVLTLELAALIKMTHCRPREYEYELTSGRLMRREFRELCLDQAHNFNVAQKSFDGFQARCFEAINALKNRGFNPRTMYAPREGGIFFRGAGDWLRADVNGERGPRLRDINPETPTGIAGLTVKLTRDYRESKKDMPFDPLVENKVMGQYFTAKGPRVDAIDPNSYRTVHRDILIYDMELDNMRRITLREIVENLPWEKRDEYGNTWMTKMAPDFPHRTGATDYEIDRNDANKFLDKIAKFSPLAPFDKYAMGDLFGCYVGGGASTVYTFVRQLGDVQRDFLPMDMMFAMATAMLARNIHNDIPIKRGKNQNVVGEIDETFEEQYIENRRDNDDAYNARVEAYPTVFEPLGNRNVTALRVERRDFKSDYVSLDTDGLSMLANLDNVTDVPRLANNKTVDEFKKGVVYIVAQNGYLSDFEAERMQKLYTEAVKVTSALALTEIDLGPNVVRMQPQFPYRPIQENLKLSGVTPAFTGINTGDQHDNQRAETLRQHQARTFTLLGGKTTPPKTMDEIKAAHKENTEVFKGANQTSYDSITTALKGTEELQHFVSNVHQLRTSNEPTDYHTKIFTPLNEVAVHLEPSQTAEQRGIFKDALSKFTSSVPSFINSSSASTATKVAPLKVPSTLNFVSANGKQTQTASVKHGRPSTGGRTNPESRNYRPQSALDAETDDDRKRLPPPLHDLDWIRDHPVDPSHQNNDEDYNIPEWDWRIAEIEASHYDEEIKNNCYAIMRMKITLETFLYLLQWDIPFPFQFLIMRPWIQMNTASTIVGEFGSTLGFTALGPNDMMFGDDISNKTHELHYTVYANPVIVQKLALFNMPDAWCRHYLGGMNTKWFTRDDIEEMKEHGYAPSDARDAPSMYPVITPYYTPYLNPVIDIRRQFYGLNEAEDNEFHFITTRACQDPWEFSPAMKLNYPYEPAIHVTNTIVIQGQQWCWNPFKHDLSGEIIGRDNFGTIVYGGMRGVYEMKDRNSPYLDPNRKMPGYAISM